MSRIGAKSIGLPNGVTVEVKNRVVHVTGPKGELTYALHPEIDVDVVEKEVLVKRVKENENAKAYHGLTRSLLKNMIIGVADGHKRSMEIVGVGYKVQLKPTSLTFSLGFSHPVEFPLPKGITVTQDEKNKNLITIQGIDKQLVGQVAANIREYRKPEPYKGKGIRYTDEIVRRKPGKAAAAKGAA
ncbi:MAG: 50S ribosomal protein L6 [Candidatus Peribacteraceae bacterium]